MGNNITKNPLLIDTAQSGPVDMVTAGLIPAAIAGILPVAAIQVYKIVWVGPTTTGHTFSIVDAAGRVIASYKISAAEVAGTIEIPFIGPGGIGALGLGNLNWYVSQISSGTLQLYF